jgi:MinD superfamily P-loop ATPase
MKEILVISGKGGAGKTTVTAAFSFFLNQNDVIVDCDVDAADMHILFEPDYNEKFDFFSGKDCFVDEAKCTGCGICEENCHYNAIKVISGKAQIDALECEHCLLCYNLCPENSIEVKEMHCGKYFISNTRTGKRLVHANLFSGADNSGKLVSTVRNEAKKVAQKQNSEFILIDGPPGIGCPVIASITGVKYTILVTEPTMSGFSDLKRVVEITKHFKIKAGCVINKASINREIKSEIEKFCIENNISILGELPYSKKFYVALTEKKSIIEIDEEFKEVFSDIWKKIEKEVI